jgi:Spy/CpxP family protein refolding chaperone
MKKIYSIIAALLISTLVVNAQDSNKEEVEMFQALFGKEKKELVKDLIKLNADQTTKFWPIYDKYEVERKELGKERIDLIKNLADAYGNMNAEKADAVVKQTISLRTKQEKVLNKYYKSMKSTVGPEKAFEFYQFESYLLTEVRSAIMEQIPLYSQFKDDGK